MKAKCNRCGKELDEIKFVEPDWSGQSLDYILCRRPPLCESCWDKADREEAERQHNRDIDRLTRRGTYQ